ncbi:MAG TPA: type IV pilus secretin PilQ [Myxococcota bacterium]|nr:type IV pilus secretin PilQ [Myxococcota bacterium]HRY95133.1 type IV pilus secretin PilQ [Myxococcota bacterium]
MASRKVVVSWLVVLALGVGGAATGVAGEADNLVTGLEVQAGAHATQVVLHARSTPTFTVFKLKNPDRLVLDLLNADLGEDARQPRVVDDGRVGRIGTTQFRQAGSLVSRVIVGLREGVRFNARTEGSSVIVSIQDKDAPADSAAAPAPEAVPAPEAAPAEAAQAEAAEVPAPAAAAVAAPALEAEVPPPPAPPADFKVVETHGQREGAAPVAIRRVRPEAAGLSVETNRPVVAYEVLEVYNPLRLVVDIYGGALRRKAIEQKLEGSVAERVRLAQHDGKVRMVIDLAAGARPSYRIEKGRKGLQIRFDSVQPAAEETASATVQGAAAEPASAAGALAKLQDLTFRQVGGESRVILDVQGEAAPKVVHADGRSAVLEIPGCQMSALLERTLDTSEFGGVVQSLAAYRVQASRSIKVVAVVGGLAPSRLEREDGKLVWVFEGQAPAAPEAAAKAPAAASAESVQYAYAPDEVAGYSVRQPEMAPEGGGGARKARYTGRRISLDFKDADIHNILRLISEVAKLNIVTSDEVSGKITITMRNVPWDQALDIILKTKKLGMVKHGNIIRVAKLEELAKEQEMQAKAEEAKKVLEPLRVRLIAVNYARAKDIETQVRNLLSERGTISIDERTNVLIIKDVLENLVKAEGLVRSLDTETPQVLIEARVVEANTQYLRQVGIQWGPRMDFTGATGSNTGLPFPNDISIRGGADQPDSNKAESGTGNPGNFAINLPAAVGMGSGGALGFIFGSAGGAVGLNLRLSALENKGAVKIISAPKVTTLDNKKAKISQGVSIPITVTSAAGANTVFVEARLELEVTPHITQEGSVLLEIDVKKNEPDFSRTGAKGDPTILRKEAQTQVLVKDGDTTVIGGIYTRKTSDNVAGIPVLSHIPILGWLFRNTQYNDERTELLIFITPRIVNRLQSSVTAKQ